MKKLIAPTLLVLLSFCTVAVWSQENDIQRLKNAIVKIHTTSAAPDYFTPWRLLNPQQSSGSGAVIAENRILTNAHVIADARYIQAQKNGSPQKYLAKVAFVSHEADLAILQVEDKSFFDDLRPLEVGNLPEPLQEVSVYGYPFGGNSLSITKGILSRVEHQHYAHGGSFLLAGQIDAAINPGNSGGPVIVNNEIVGVVMQANVGRSAENQGYFVPPSIIKHVLTDSLNGAHNGMPDLGFRTQSLESPAMKAAFGVDPNTGGVLVSKVFKNSPASELLKLNDVLLEVDGYKIADDSSIEVRRNLRTDYKYAIDQHHVGDTVKLTISRNGETQELELVARERLESYSLVTPKQFDQLPEYYLYGGVVFVPLNMNLIERWGNDWRNKAPVDFLYARNRWASQERRELVVAIKVLAAEVNLGYHNWNNWVIESINDVPIRDFRQFCQLIRNSTKPYTILKDEDGFQMVIDNQVARATEQEIMNLYQVPAPYSLGLFPEPGE
jgi:S1-C subfamily serine protease